MKTLAQRFNELLQARNGGNLAEVARFAGVSRQAAQQWLAGATSPRGKHLIKVAEFLGVTPAELQYGSMGDDKARSGITPAAEGPIPIGYAALPEDQRRLLEIYRKLKPAKRRLVLELLQNLT